MRLTVSLCAAVLLSVPVAASAQTAMCMMNTSSHYQRMGGERQLGPLPCDQCQATVNREMSGASCSQVSSSGSDGYTGPANPSFVAFGRNVTRILTGGLIGGSRSGSRPTERPAPSPPPVPPPRETRPPTQPVERPRDDELERTVSSRRRPAPTGGDELARTIASRRQPRPAPEPSQEELSRRARARQDTASRDTARTVDRSVNLGGSGPSRTSSSRQPARRPETKP